MRRALLGLLCSSLGLPHAWGWGADVHRTITHLALADLPSDAPAWLRDPAVQERIAFQSNQPDRWRGWDSRTLRHENHPDHYLDADRLPEFGLTLETVPPLRRDYIRALVVGGPPNPEPTASPDPASVQAWPGFVLHAIAEQYAKLQAALHQVRILEQLADPERRQQLEQARAIAVDHLGNLAHFVADVAQPLHTTKHFNGWIGANPHGYHWRERFHMYIDEGWARTHAVTFNSLRPAVHYDIEVNATDPSTDVVAYFARSFSELERLYALERDGELDAAAGRDLLTARLTDATAMLHAMIEVAWKSSTPTPAQVETWLRYDDSRPRAASQPASATNLTADGGS